MTTSFAWRGPRARRPLSGGPGPRARSFVEKAVAAAVEDRSGRSPLVPDAPPVGVRSRRQPTEQVEHHRGDGGAHEAREEAEPEREHEEHPRPLDGRLDPPPLLVAHPAGGRRRAARRCGTGLVRGVPGDRGGRPAGPDVRPRGRRAPRPTGGRPPRPRARARRVPGRPGPPPRAPRPTRCPPRRAADTRPSAAAASSTVAAADSGPCPRDRPGSRAARRPGERPPSRRAARHEGHPGARRCDRGDRPGRARSATTTTRWP